MESYISALVISFFVYGFAGWIWESFVCPILTRHRIKNSGFLNGPIVPIYGVGALCVSLLFSPQESVLSIFIEGAFVACVIEYLTSWGMEKLYHRRWWDYSDKAFQVNGRVCLEGFLVFGLFSVVAVKWIQPALLNKIMSYDTVLLIVLATILSTLLVVDSIVTVIELTHLDDMIEDMKGEVEKILDDFEESIQSWPDLLDSQKQVSKELLKRKKFSQRRIVKAFPHIVEHKKDRS